MCGLTVGVPALHAGWRPLTDPGATIASLVPPEGTSHPAAIAAPPAAARRERRAGRRVRVTGLWCDRGQIIDLSARGMRLTTIRRWPEGMSRGLTLHVDGASHTITARCVWCRQDSLFAHSVGVAFEDVPADAARALDALAQQGEAIEP